MPKVPFNGTFTVDLLSKNEYYPYGMKINELSYNNGSTRYGYNGTHEQDREMNADGNYLDFGNFGYDTRVAMRRNQEPLSAKYPHLSGYSAFGSNPIIFSDPDGFQYYSVIINIDKSGKGTKLCVVDYTNSKKGYGPKGPGVEYQIHDERQKNSLKYGTIFLENNYGVYQGSENPKKYWEKPDKNGNYPDDYSLPPIDEQDASAMQHDKDYDKVGAKGIVGVLSNKTLKADQNFIKRADEVNRKYNNKINDKITGKKVTENANDASQYSKKFFNIIDFPKSNDNDNKETKKHENKFIDYGPKY